MKIVSKVIILFSIISLFVSYLIPAKTAFACSPGEITNDYWQISPVTVSPGEAITITVTNTGLPQNLYVLLNPHQSATGTFQVSAYTEIRLDATGSGTTTLTIPSNLTDGDYPIALADLANWSNICSQYKSISITGAPPVEPPPAEGCATINQSCSVGITILCDPDLTYCNDTRSTTGWGVVEPKGGLLAPCIKSGDSYICGAGEPSSQDSSCICQPPIPNPYNGADYLCYNGTIAKPEINSAIGCIPFPEPNSIATFFVVWGTRIVGGMAILMFILAGVTILTSSGNPDKINEGKAIFMAAIAGVLMIIFSVALLKFIGFDILKIFL